MRRRNAIDTSATMKEKMFPSYKNELFVNRFGVLCFAYSYLFLNGNNIPKLLASTLNIDPEKKKNIYLNKRNICKKERKFSAFVKVLLLRCRWMLKHTNWCITWKRKRQTISDSYLENIKSHKIFKTFHYFCCSNHYSSYPIFVYVWS